MQQGTVSDDFVRHWMSRPHGPSQMRNAAHTLIVLGTSKMRAGDTNGAEECFGLACELLTTANDSESGVYDD